MKADFERIYIKSDGSHGVIKLEVAYSSAIVSFNEYIKLGKFTRLITEHVVGKAKYSHQKEAYIFQEKHLKPQETTSHSTKSQCKSCIEKEKIELHKNKLMHRQFYRAQKSILKQPVDCRMYKAEEH